MESLRAMCDQRRLLSIGDSKLVSFDNLSQITVGGDRHRPASKAYIGADVLARCDWDAAVPVGYIAQRDTGKPAEARASCRVLEDAWMMPPPRSRKGSGIELRRIFVWFSAHAQAAAKSRAKKLDRACDDLDKVTRGLGGRHYPTPDKVQARVTTIATKRRVGDYRRTIGTDADRKPTLRWHFDQAALDAETATDGWYCLLTNLDPTDADTGDVMVRYKGQEVAERRYGDFKGPLAVAPMFLKNNRRTHALLSIIYLARLIFCLVEREAQAAIAPDQKLTGLGGYRDARPTGRNLFDALADMPLIPATANGPPIIPAPVGLHARSLELLDVDPTTTR